MYCFRCPCAPSLINNEEQLPAMDCRSTASSTVGVCSTARRKRNHVVNGMRRAVCGGRSPRSRAIRPKPPLSSNKSVARKSCSKRCSGSCESDLKKFLFSVSEPVLRVEFFCGVSSPHRTHSNRSNSIPASATHWGSRASPASTTAQHSPRPVAAASADSNKVVRPEEAGPQISVKHPRGSPPVSASIAAMPLDIISGVGRTANREAGVTPASLESLKAPRKFSEPTRCGGRASPKSSPPEGFGHTFTTSPPSKTKGRPWAAEVENTAVDINSSESFRERRGWQPRLAFSLFIRLEEFCSQRLGLSSCD